MSDLASLMTACIDQKTGNKEFGLFYMPDYGWHVRIGSDSRWVVLGEVEGEIRTDDHPTAEAAVAELLAKISAPPAEDI
jgi:hypothetical protein